MKLPFLVLVFGTCLIVSLFLGSFYAQETNAQSIGLPFGGQVLFMATGGMYCTGGTEVFYLRGVGSSPSGRYTVSVNASRYKYYSPLFNSWILGKYTPATAPCFIPGTPPIYVGQANLITLFGTSM